MDNDFEHVAMEELEYAKENDYVLYFDLLMEGLAGAEDPDAEMLRLYDEHWEKVKEAIKKDYFHETADGVLAKPSPNNMHSLHDNYHMLYGNTINDIEIGLNNAGRYDDRVKFAQDCLDYFDLLEGDDDLSLNYMNFSLAIGEALSDGGHIEESNTYYEKLLSEYPDNGYMIANYILTLHMRGEKEKAKALLESHVSLDMEPTEENEMLFERAREIYEEEGNVELAAKYEAIQNQVYDRKKQRNLNDLRNISDRKAFKNKTKVRDSKKVYPNDPCPCGSELKYKKCCGKK